MAEDSHFATTRWTQVRAAQDGSSQADTALADLCATYYAPVHAYVSRTSRDLGDPRDLTHEFFARILGGGTITGAARESGRFRAYLLGAVKHFLADTRDRLSAAKRGARHEHLHLDDGGTDTSPGMEIPAAELSPPEILFDKQWGLTVLGMALDALAAELARQDKAEHFEQLKPWLTGEAGETSQSETAARLGLSVGAVKVAIHRLRQRFRNLVKAEIAQTVSSEEEAREEMRYLIEVVSYPS